MSWLAKAPPVPVSVNDVLRVNRILSFNLVVVKPDTLRASIAVFILVSASSYVSSLSVVTVQLFPATAPLYVVSTDVPDILYVPCLLALKVGSAFLAATIVLFVIMDLSCIVSTS